MWPMRFIALILTLCWSMVVFSQDDLDVQFLQTQRTQGNPFALPMRINQHGEISFFGGNGTENLNFRPTMQLGFSAAIINYSHPVILNRFNFYPQQPDLGWIEVKRLRLEAGLGLSTIIRQVLTVGLLPYKGAMNTIIRHKASREDKSLPFKMPKKLNELVEWNINDLGTFQMYGGITAYAGLSFGLVDIALGSVGIQNQFIVEMKKNDPKTVKLTISEEDLKRRQVIVGPSVVEATFAQFKGQRLSTEFLLDLNNPEHHVLFEEALKGNLSTVQEKLETSRQKLLWQGHDRSYYVGIPILIGTKKDAGHYDLEEDGMETKLDFTGSRTTGILTPMRNLQDFVYQTDEAMLVVWSSEMNKTSKRVFEKRFLNIGKTIGIKGFNREVPDNTKFGSVVSQIAVHISKKEIELVSDIDLTEVAVNLKAKCEEQQLPCRKESRITQIIKQLTELKLKPWKEMRGDLGLLLIKEPAIIHAVVKTMKFKKDVYFKFLSEKYQSLEGSSAIEI
jgi:hypothetical protein